jgi:glutamate-1-semialdehyde 2,1-aminomutase
VLTEEAYEKLNASNRKLLDGCQAIIEQYGLPAYTEGIGAKGCVIFSPERLHEYRDYLTKVNGDLATLAWLYHMNHGIFMTPGVEEEWTISIAHSEDDIQHYLDAFEAVARDVTTA